MVKIFDCYVNISKTIVYPEFMFENSLKEEVKFLLSESKYFQYCINRDSVLKRKEKKNLEIRDLGTFYPLSDRHIRNSYWKGFRKPGKINQDSQLKLEKLQRLFPLKLDGAKLLTIRSNNDYFPSKLKIDFFPFGVVVINYRINVSKVSYSIGQLNELINNLTSKHRASIDGKLSLDEDILEINNKLIKNFFQTPSTVNPLFDDKYHSIITIRNMDQKPIIDDPIIKNDVTKDLSNLLLGEKRPDLREDAIRDTLRCRIRTRGDEFIVFYPKRTIIIPRADLIENHTRKSRSTIVCLRNNYENMLSILFALNRFISRINSLYDNSIGNFKSIVDMIELAFPQDPESKYHYSYALKEISQRINFGKEITKFKSKFY